MIKDRQLRSRRIGFFILFVFFFGSCAYFKTGPSEEELQKIKLIETKVLLAQNKLEQARPQAALLELRSLDQKHPNNPMILNMLGLVHLALKNEIKALESLEKAHKIEPTKIAYGLNLSSVYLSVGKISQARELLVKLAEDDSYHYKERLLHNIALTYENEGDLKNAKAFYEEALVENPVYYLSMIGLGKVYEKQSNLNKAFHSYKKAAQYCPTCYEAREKLAYFYAPRSLKKALKILSSFMSIEEVARSDRDKAARLRRKLEGKYSKSL